MKAVIIEDSEDISDLIRLCISLRWPQCECHSTPHGREGLRLIESLAPDLVILDIALPDGHGLDFLKEIRAFSDVPTLIVSARSDDLTKVKGLELGADDYIVKPFSHTELLARILAVLRRAGMGVLKEYQGVVQTGNLSIDFSSGRVQIDNKEITLSSIEWKFLQYLTRNEKRIIPVETILDKVWGLDYVERSAVKTCVRRLRIKLGDDRRSPQLIRSYRGRGYSLEFPAGTNRV